MDQKLRNKIEATDSNIKKLLSGEKFTIDYFQREYRWEQKHIFQLVEDLASAFLKSYSEDHERPEVENYQNYYLGPTVFSVDDSGNKSIVDGQQRITSLTLLLIYLNHLQKNRNDQVSISDLIYSEKFGNKSFNMLDEDRKDCLTALFNDGEYEPAENEDETVQSIVERYRDIESCFPDELEGAALPFFIDWFIYNVILVKITAYSDDNAYTIFETMNDRGLNLTPTEMLKGYVLSKVSDKTQRNELNDIWKQQIQKLHKYRSDADITFFQAWFRGKYAQSIRPGKAGAENQDFELIGSAFHRWFRDKHEELYGLRSSQEFYNFFKLQFPFFVDTYLRIWDSYDTFTRQFEYLFYIRHWGIADSLQEPLLLSPIVYGDNEQVVRSKLNSIARYIETFTVKRGVNFRKFGQTAIKYSMFNVIKTVRSLELSDLRATLAEEVDGIDESWQGVENFYMHGQNRRFIKHLLSRISSYVDEMAGKDVSYKQYGFPDGKPFEIEHIWADKFDQHRDEFDQESDFKIWRNSIGDLILLPNGTNQSFNSDRYEDKLVHYIKENTYAQTLNSIFYEKNPNFLKSPRAQSLQFRPHEQFKKDDLIQRQQLVQRICEQMWSSEYFRESQ